MARIYESPENEVAIKLMQGMRESDDLKEAGGDNEEVELAGGISPAEAHKVHHEQNKEYSDIIGGGETGDHHESSERTGAFNKLKDKAKKMKETIKREFGKSDPSGASQQPIPAPPLAAGATKDKPVPDDLPEQMTRPVAGDQTPVAGIQEGRSLNESVGTPEILGKDFHFPSPTEDAVSGKDEKTVADIAKLRANPELFEQVKLHGAATPLEIASALQPPSEMTGFTPPFEPPVYAHSRKLHEEEPLREEAAEVPEGVQSRSLRMQDSAYFDALDEVDDKDDRDEVSLAADSPAAEVDEKDGAKPLAKGNAENPKSLQEEVNDLVGTPAKQANASAESADERETKSTGVMSMLNGGTLTAGSPNLFTGGAFAPAGGVDDRQQQREEEAELSGQGQANVQADTHKNDDADANDEHTKKKSTSILGFVESMLAPVIGSSNSSTNTG